MKPLIASVFCLLILAFSTAPLSAGGFENGSFIESPVLVYDCNLVGQFKFSQVYDYDTQTRGEDEIRFEDCLEGYGLTKKFKLKSFVVTNNNGCIATVYYGECMMETYDERTEKTKMKKQKFYWFDNDNYPYSPYVCYTNTECHYLVDSVCDGIRSAKNGKKGKVPVRQTSDDDDGPAYGKKFARSIFLCEVDGGHSMDPCDIICDDIVAEEPPVLQICDGGAPPLTALGFDFTGPMTKCKISTKMAPTAKPFKYLDFMYGRPDRAETRTGYICAPKKLCGPYFSYYLNRSGETCAYPNPYMIRVNPDLTIEPGQSAYNSRPGYDLACINSCVNYRLNTMLTGMTNMLDPVSGYEGSDKLSYDWLDMPSSEPEDRSGRSDTCNLYPQNIDFGVLMVGLYLESKGYCYDRFGVECVTNQALCLPNSAP